MAASIEWTHGIVRAGPEHKVFGDPYEFACVVIRDGDSCKIKGGRGTISIAAARSIQDALLEAGMTEIQWERKRGNT